MKIVGIKAKKGEKQYLIPGKVYDVEESTGEAILKAGRAKKQTAKKED